MDFEIEWGYDQSTAETDYSGRIEVYDGRVAGLSPLDTDTGTTMTNASAWRSPGKAGSRRGVKASLLYMGTSKWRRSQPFTTQSDDVARTIVTVWTAGGNFSFLAADLENGPILAPEYGFFVRRTSKLPAPQAAATPDLRVPRHMLSEKMFSIAGEKNLLGWGSDATPWFGGNPTDAAITVQGITFPAHSIAMHPGAEVDVAVGWCSPIAGRVKVAARVTHVQNGSNGIESERSTALAPVLPADPPIELASQALSAQEFLQELRARRLTTIRQQLRTHEEQTWEGAVTAMRGDNLPPHPAPPAGSEPAMQVQVPCARLTAQWNLGAWHLVRHAEIHPQTGRLWFNDHPYGILGAETYMILAALDLMGSHKAAEDGFDQWVSLPMDPDSTGHHEWALPDRPNGLFTEGHGCLTHAVGPPGVGGQMDGVHAFGPGSIGWALTEHYWLTGDTQWLKASAATDRQPMPNGWCASGGR